jgi:hypothetical protein
MVSHAKSSMPIKVLTNNAYETSLGYFKKHGVPGASDIGRSSLDRFSILSGFVSGYAPGADDAVAAKAFAVLDSVRQPNTVFQVVLDLQRRIVYFRSSRNPKLRYFSSDAFDYSCDTPSLILDLNEDYSNDVAPMFRPYSREANEKLIRAAWTNLGYRNIAAAALSAVSLYPETFKNAKSTEPRPSR